MKTRNLTQISFWNDPINRWMHGFSFRVFEDEIEVQDVFSPLSSDKTLISSSLWMRKCIKNTRNQMALEIGVWTVQISRNFKGNSFRHEELIFKGWIWARLSDEGAHRDQRSDEASFRKSLCLIDDCPIGDEGFRCVHVTRRRRCVVSSHSFDLHLMVTINRKILRSQLIVNAITP